MKRMSCVVLAATVTLLLSILTLSYAAAAPLKTFVVNSSGDAPDNNTTDSKCKTGNTIGGQPECTLRAAIQQANALGSATITFEIGSGGLVTIKPKSPLPTVSAVVTLDAATQPSCSSYPCVQLNGAKAGGGNGLVLSGGASTLRGFIIVNFLQAGIVLSGKQENVVQGNYIGVDATGTTASGNGIGILVSASSKNQIGGTTPETLNLISGNKTDGIELSGDNRKPNHIEGNYIGTDISGDVALGNLGEGVHIIGGKTVVGGTSFAAHNLISGNGRFLSNSGPGDGVEIEGSHNIVIGNYIGTNAEGTTALANANAGVWIRQGSNNRIGGTTAGERNVISGNGRQSDGVYTSGEDINIDGTDNLVEGNYIGTNATADSAIGALFGIFVRGENNTIGGVTADARNIISGNSTGIQLASATDTFIQGNYIGTDASGTNPLGNTAFGIREKGDDTNNTIGGIATGAGNVIAFNGQADANTGGVIVFGDSTGSSIRGNSIHDNLGLGIDLGQDGVTANDVGDADKGANNLQNFPILQSVSDNMVNGVLHSKPSTRYNLDLYFGHPCDPSGYGEGAAYGASTFVTTDSNGDASFTALWNHSSLPIVSVYITATATDPKGNTSEFSNCIPSGF